MKSSFLPPLSLLEDILSQNYLGGLGVCCWRKIVEIFR